MAKKIPDPFKGERLRLKRTEYAHRKARLSKVMSFRFKSRKKFTPKEKEIITKAWNKHKDSLKSLQEGRAQFVKATPYQRRNLRAPDRTNKGIIVREGFNAKVKLFGKGKRITIITDRHSRREIFSPLPKGMNILQHIRQTIKDYKPDLVALGVSGYHGREAYDPVRAMRYIKNIVTQYDNRDKEHPFDGIYLIFNRYAD